MRTGATITNDEIQNLQDAANRCTEMACTTCHDIWRTTRDALAGDAGARERCAQIINEQERR